MADAGLVLGILAHGKYSRLSDDDRRGDEIVARAFADRGIEGVFRVAIELPDQLARFRLEGPHPAVAAGEDNLRRALHLGIDRIGPLTVHQDFALVLEVADVHGHPRLAPAASTTLGELFVQITLPSFLATAMKLGAFGLGMLMWP